MKNGLRSPLLLHISCHSKPPTSAVRLGSLPGLGLRIVSFRRTRSMAVLGQQRGARQRQPRSLAMGERRTYTTTKPAISLLANSSPSSPSTNPSSPSATPTSALTSPGLTSAIAPSAVNCVASVTALVVPSGARTSARTAFRSFDSAAGRDGSTRRSWVSEIVRAAPMGSAEDGAMNSVVERRMWRHKSAVNGAWLGSALDHRTHPLRHGRLRGRRT